MAEQIYKYMLDNTKFDLPVDVVGEQSTALLQRQYSNLMMRGLSREQIEEQMEQLRAGSEQQAKEQLKTFFIMAKIAEKFEIDVSEEEINGYIAQLAVQRGQRPERMREEMVRDGSLAQFRLQVREDKCIAKLLESARITEIEPKKKAATITAKKTAKKTTKKAATAEEKRSQARKTTAQKRKPKGKNTR
jgi:trigger factor